MRFDGVRLSEVTSVSRDGTVRLADVDATPVIHEDVVVGGSVVIHAKPPGEDYDEMVWMRAPDRRDLSLLRTARLIMRGEVMIPASLWGGR